VPRHQIKAKEFIQGYLEKLKINSLPKERMILNSEDKELIHLPPPLNP
jgi:hypothetical protein